MSLRHILGRFAYLISAPRCVACDLRLSPDDKALCPSCMEELRENMSRNCSRCSRLLCRCSCSGEYLEAHGVKQCVKAFRYLRRDENNASTRLIFSLKKDNRSDVLDLCCDLLYDAIAASFNDADTMIFTAVPRRRRTRVEFGIDHAHLLSSRIAARFGAEYMPLFVSQAKRAQKTMQGTQRIRNAKFAIKSRAELKGKIVIIIDDLITTGASMCACAALARQLGARRVIAASLGITYKDKFTPPQLTYY